MSIGQEYLKDAGDRFHQYKEQADKAIAQVGDDDLFRTLDGEANSIAILMRHLAGNMRSRWEQFMTTDGEKPTRHRDQEFEMPAGTTRAALLADWESGWTQLFSELKMLTPDDLEKTVYTRHEPTSALSAINRQLGHAALHIGQIIMLAKHFRSGQWRTLTIPRGQSEAFNETMRRKFAK